MMRYARISFLLILGNLLVAGCSEINREAAPVLLTATAAMNTTVVDVASPPELGAIADVLMRASTKRTDVTDTRFLDVKLSSYRVSYRRTDGGTLVPEPFTVSVQQLVAINGAAASLDNFIAFEPGAFNRAPFAALLPTNTGRDPETGRATVEIDVVVDVFGETLAGDEVAAQARFPVTICYGCTVG